MVVFYLGLTARRGELDTGEGDEMRPQTVWRVLGAAEARRGLASSDSPVGLGSGAANSGAREIPVSRARARAGREEGELGEFGREG